MSKQPDHVVTVYRGEFRWRLTYNNLVLADSGQGYNRRPTAIAAARKNGVGQGFPVVLRFEKPIRNRLTWVQERIR